MSCTNLQESKIPQRPCSCGHHKKTQTCCHKEKCKSKIRRRTQSSEKERSVATDESMAGEPHAGIPRAAENTYNNSKIKISNLQKELIERNNEIKELNEKLKKLMEENKNLNDHRDELMNKVDSLQEQFRHTANENKSIKCECETLKKKLEFVEDRENKKTSEITGEVQAMRDIVKEKEDSLNREKNKLNKTIQDLTDTVTQQKGKINDLMRINGKQKAQIEKLTGIDEKLEAKCCECNEIQDELENLKVSLNEKAKAANSFKNEMEVCKENCKCELMMKDKTIEDQAQTIERLKNVLRDNEKIAKQAARDYEMLTDQLFSEKQENMELKMTLQEITENIRARSPSRHRKCHRCFQLEHKLNSIYNQKEKAVAAADYATEKLCQTTDAYQTQIKLGKHQHKFLISIIEQKEEEIECLKKEIQHLTLCN